MRTACILAAKRTPFGRFGGALKERSAVDLAQAAARPVLDALPDVPIDQVIVVNVLGAGLGMNGARQIGIGLGLPQTVPAYTVNMVCGSGMHAIVLAAEAIQSGRAKAILCGGTESMSNAPHLLRRNHRSPVFGGQTLEDAILSDGLTDAFDGSHMGTTAERLATKYNIDRGAQDAYAAGSQARYAAAQEQGLFDAELVQLEELACDEHPRPGTTAEKLGGLRPAFAADGTVTAGNASGINDGAAMLVVADQETARELDWPVLALIGAFSEVGCDPQEMGLGPVHAIRGLLAQTSNTLADYDRIEINEAFAAQVLACLNELELGVDRVNQCGGAIALGHPIATSGARLVVHLAHQLAAGRSQKSLASLCIGGGQGIAMQLSRCSR